MRTETRICVSGMDDRPLLRKRIAAQLQWDNEVAPMFGSRQFCLKKTLLLGLCVLLAGCGARVAVVGRDE